MGRKKKNLGPQWNALCTCFVVEKSETLTSEAAKWLRAPSGMARLVDSGGLRERADI